MGSNAINYLIGFFGRGSKFIHLSYYLITMRKDQFQRLKTDYQAQE